MNTPWFSIPAVIYRDAIQLLLLQFIIVCPHADDFHGSIIFDSAHCNRFRKHLIDKSVLDIDAPGIEALQISNQSLI